MKKRVVLALPLPPAAMERAAAEFDLWAPEAPAPVDKVVEVCGEREAQGLVVFSSHKVRAEQIARLPDSLRIIATTSVGFEHIDLAAARSRGIVVTHTPDVLSDATADTAMLLILGASRRVKEQVRNMDGGWQTLNGFNRNLGWDVHGKRLGIVGMGRIGRALAERARGFRMPILYHNRKRLPSELEQGAQYFASLDEMLPHCQVLALTLPGGQGVVMTPERFALLPRGAVFTNVARGDLVDEAALEAALRSGQLAAAGLDVYAKEPTYNQALNGDLQTFLLPHTGSATIETRTAMAMLALDNVAAVLTGRPPLTEVRP